jgi:hypothetical protein
MSRMFPRRSRGSRRRQPSWYAGGRRSPRPAPCVDILRELAVVPVPTGGSGHTARANSRDAGQARRGSRTTCAAPAEYRAGVGRPSTGRRSASSGPGRPAPHRQRCQGEAVPGFQWGRPKPGCSSNTTASDAGTIHYRGTTYPGRAQESPRGRRGPTGRKLCLPKAGVPPEHRAATSRFMREASVHNGRTRDTAPAATGRLGNEHHRHNRRAHLDEKVQVLHPNHPVRRLSAEPFDGRRSRPGSEPRLPSPSTRGRQGRNCGSRTTGWPASWVERTMTTSSSATSPCSSPTPPGPGWSICLLRRSPTGTTWSKPSPATSRAHTCAPGTPGIFEAAASSWENPCGTTSGDFQSSALSCPTSPTPMSSARSSPAPLAATW